MANRVILGAFDGSYVLRVSRPGFNVLSTGLTPEQLAFDSRWSEAGNVLMSGSLSISSGSAKRVAFGETLSAPPMVIVAMEASATQLRLITGAITGEDGREPATVSVYTTAFYIESGYLGARMFYYTVFRNLYD